MLRAAGIPFEVVPGHHRRHRRARLRRASRSPSATCRAPSRSSPGTRTRPSRRRSSTGRRSPRFPGTLVFYMGVRSLARIASQLVAGGRPPDEPVAIVERGTHARPAHDARRRSPTVAARGRRARASRRRRSRSSATVAALGERARLARARGRCTGARSRSPAPAPRRPRWRRGCASSAPRSSRRRPSARARSRRSSRPRRPRPDRRHLPQRRARALRAARAHGRDARALAGHRIAAMGPGTARALREHGIVADVVPTRAVAEGLVEALADDAGRQGAARPRPRGPRHAARRAARRGAEVTVLALYETIAEPLDGRRSTPRPAPTGSPSPPPPRSASSPRRPAARCPTGRGWRRSARRPRAALREHGREPDLEADPHTPDGLVDALVNR